jgi:putative transposase
MPRKPREFVDGGIYHVFNRGNNRRELFRDKFDFASFLSLLAQNQAKYAINLFHYCLMTNHFHLLLRIKSKEDLPQFMHGLQLSYARYFKKKYDTTGHILEERFRSPRIAEESYYLQCGRYIERNPVKAGMVKQAWDYPYSSASYYAQGTEDKLITPNFYYLEMGSTEQERKESYRKFLLLDEPYASMIENQLVTY